MSSKIQLGFFYSKVLMSFLKRTVGRWQKDTYLFVVLICVCFKMLVINKLRYNNFTVTFYVTGENSQFGSGSVGMPVIQSRSSARKQMKAPLVHRSNGPNSLSQNF